MIDRVPLSIKASLAHHRCPELIVMENEQLFKRRGDDAQSSLGRSCRMMGKVRWWAGTGMRKLFGYYNCCFLMNVGCDVTEKA